MYHVSFVAQSSQAFCPAPPRIKSALPCMLQVLHPTDSNSNMQKHGVQILGQMKPEYSSVLTPEAVAFIGHIQRKFGSRVLDLLQKRKDRQAK